MSWADLAEWWRGEVDSDPSYEDLVDPLLLEVLPLQPDSLYVDVGCGEGRVMRALRESGMTVIGLDISLDLARSAGQAALGDAQVPPFRDATFDVAYSVLTLDHLPDHRRFFLTWAQVVRTDGFLVVVVNHPFWTAPESTPITIEDGEVLWRPGEYLSRGEASVPAGDARLTFFHRSIGGLLGAAAEAGWCLEGIEERSHPRFPDQEGIPRLLACRWRNKSDGRIGGPGE